MKPAKTLYIIEANIAAGKTTLIKELRNKSFAVHEEPLTVWKERYVEKDGTNILGLFYDDMARWSFQFEVMAFVTRIEELRKALQSEQPVVFVERSIFIDYHVFAPNLLEQGKMKDIEWKIYEDWYKLAVEGILLPMLSSVNVEFIYIDTDPRICWERKSKRDRKEEKPMPLEYLIQLDKRHKDWLFDVDFPYPVHQIDGHCAEAQVLQQVLSIFTNLTN